MDIEHKIQIGNSKNINSVNVDTSFKIKLDNVKNDLTEFDVESIINVTNIYDIERQETLKYRIYGSIDYLSLLNGLGINYTLLENFFQPETPNEDGDNVKTLLNSFKIYLLRPSSKEYNYLGDNNYLRKFDVISEIDNIEIFNAGFSKSIFNQQKYIYDFNIDVDLTGKYDYFNFPLTDVFLYFLYQPTNNGNGVTETVQTRLDTDSWTSFTTTSLNLGETIDGDVINYNKNNFNQTISKNKYFKIITQYVDGSTSKNLEWYFNPLIKVNLRAFADDLEKGNLNDTSYEITDKIPEYATLIDDDGNYVWKNILDVGFIDPITNTGVSYPFVNKSHYIFNNIVFSIQPYFYSNNNTQIVFDEIKLSDYTAINTKPISDINNFGKPCQ